MIDTIYLSMLENMVFVVEIVRKIFSISGKILIIVIIIIIIIVTVIAVIMEGNLMRKKKGIL